ncbi:MAG: hypothetical protein HUU37_06250 [Bdellovibrionales bacterium]|nr:hypothetical protein [Bdellovibrionales bacterium]
MKGLAAIPGPAEMARAYAKLQGAKGALAPERIVRMAQWSRFDPRLLEQLVSHLALYWEDISPLALRKGALASPWPATLAVVLEHAALLFRAGKRERQELQLFSYWSKMITLGIPPAENELYFIGLSAFGGKRAREEALYSSEPYRKWGFFGRDIAIQKWSGDAPRSLSLTARKNIALDLAKRERRFTVGAYLFACGNAISRRQAERDLGSFSFLDPRGKNRARVYVYRGALDQ